MAVDVSDLPNDNAAQPVRRRTSRLTVLGILALCAAPVIASYLAYYFFPPEGRAIYGSLVEPQIEVSDLGGTPAPMPAGQEVAPDAGSVPQESIFARLRGRWALVVVAPGACPGDCAQRLYSIRQVRLAQGRDAERLERVWLVTDGQQPAAELLAQHSGMQVWFTAQDQLRQRFPANATADGFARIYLVDPHGQLMMQFPIGADPGRIRKDLARLLKISRIG